MNLADDVEHEVRLDQLVADFIEARERGEQVDVERWVLEHAEFMAELREFLRGYGDVWVKGPS
jgi:hypothetical protein